MIDRGKQKHALFRDILILIGACVLSVVLLLLYPDRGPVMYETTLKYFLEMVQVLPAVVILMGLFAVWITPEQVEKYLGRASGLRGGAIALVLGSLPTGPLYVAFPIAHALLAKGASTVNVTIFLSAWACIKVPQAMMELRFLGLKFMTARLVLTTGFVILMAYFIDAVVRRTERRNAGHPASKDQGSGTNPMEED
jgi:uncharacterized membrane protein YraQ (UPF0718 family)